MEQIQESKAGAAELKACEVSLREVQALTDITRKEMQASLKQVRSQIDDEQLARKNFELKVKKELNSMAKAKSDNNQIRNLEEREERQYKSKAPSMDVS